MLSQLESYSKIAVNRQYVFGPSAWLSKRGYNRPLVPLLSSVTRNARKLDLRATSTLLGTRRSAVMAIMVKREWQFGLEVEVWQRHQCYYNCLENSQCPTGSDNQSQCRSCLILTAALYAESA
jgi:hypothetical protein